MGPPLLWVHASAITALTGAPVPFYRNRNVSRFFGEKVRMLNS